MEQDAGFDSVGAASEPVIPDVNSNDGGGDSYNPAWAPVFEKLPSEFHNMISPTFKEWDQNFQKVQTAFSPYKQYADAQVSPDHINASLQLAKVLQENPRFVYDKMVETYGDEWGLNQQQVQGLIDEENDPEANAGFDGGFNPESHPMFQQMQQQMGAIAQFQQAQIEQQATQQINSEIDRDFKAIGAQYGDLSQQDVQMIAAVSLQNEVPLPKAAEIVFGYSGRQPVGSQTQQSAPKNNLPNVVPPGGGMPSQAVDPTKLNGVQTRATVAEMLKQMMESGN